MAGDRVPPPTAMRSGFRVRMAGDFGRCGCEVARSSDGSRREPDPVFCCGTTTTGLAVPVFAALAPADRGGALAAAELSISTAMMIATTRATTRSIDRMMFR